MAINILEYARIAANNGESKKAGILMTFAEQSQLLAAIPTVTIQGSAYSWVREAALPSVTFRAVGESYAESTGTTTKLTETLKAIGGDLDVDNFYVETGGAELRTIHEMMKAKALAQQIGYTLVKGAVVTGGGATGNAESFDGLQTRYGGGFGSTAVSASGPNAAQIIANNGGSDALSLAKLDEAIMAVDGPTNLLMPKKSLINLKTKLRNSASIQMTQDEFGRQVSSYNGLPILIADQNGDQAAIGFNENNDSTSSIYVLNLSEMGVQMIQSTSGVSVRDLGEQDSKPVHRTRVEWYCGLVDLGPRSVARLYNIADLAAVD